MKIDVVCPLYKAETYIDHLLHWLIAQKEVEIVQGIFPITETGNTTQVEEKILAAGFRFFHVNPKDFSHSLTRERAMMEFCTSDVVVMLSQDVTLLGEHCLYRLASEVTAATPYVYGRQICKDKSIEHYTRIGNYGTKDLVCTQADIPRMQLKTYFASDAFSAYHRPTFLELGGYDGVHMMMSEDMYYAKKVIDAGLAKKYVASAVVEHSHKLTLKQLYQRYYQTGIWFREHPEFNGYKTTDSGLKLALSVLKGAIGDFNIPVLIRFVPDMAARYLGMQKGKH